MRVFDLVKKFVDEKLHLTQKKNELEAKVKKASQDVVLKVVLPRVTKVVRGMIIDLGKNPDYVPPPPPPQTEKEPSKTRPSFRFGGGPISPSWVAASFKDPTKHPVLKHRIEIAKNGLKHEDPEDLEQPLQVAARALQELKSDSTVTDTAVYADNAIASLRATLKTMEGELFPKKPAKKKVAKKRKGSAKLTRKPAAVKAKVTRNFNGSFRRVTEE